MKQNQTATTKKKQKTRKANNPSSFSSDYEKTTITDERLQSMSPLWRQFYVKFEEKIKKNDF